MAKYKCFLNTDRFWYILSNLKSDSNFKISGNEIFKKTASFYGDNHNIYIDTSDGINEDFGIEEYGGRIKAVIKECNGKPFIFFKSFYSPSISSKIEKIANNNNGKVCPFFFWSVQNEYKQLYKNPNRNAQQGHSKAYDLGLFFDPTAYYYPKPNAAERDKQFIEKAFAKKGLYPTVRRMFSVADRYLATLNRRLDEAEAAAKSCDRARYDAAIKRLINAYVEASLYFQRQLDNLDALAQAGAE